MKRYNDQNHHVVAEETGFGLAKTNGQLHPGAETPRDSKSALHPVVWKAAQAEPSWTTIFWAVLLPRTPAP